MCQFFMNGTDSQHVAHSLPISGSKNSPVLPRGLPLMSRTRKFLSGISYGYAYQVLVTVAGLWLTPFLLQRTGQHDYGLWLVGTQVMAYLMLLDFGVVALLPRDASIARGRSALSGNREELPTILAETFRLVMWQMPLVIACALTLWLLMPAEWEPLRAPLGLVFLAFVVTFPLRVFQGALQGLQDLEFLGKTQICTWLLSIALTVALIFAGWGLYALSAGWILAQVSAALVGAFRVITRFPEALPQSLPRLPRLAWPAARGRLISGFWASINQIATVLLIGTDVVIIGKFLGPAAVVPYVCTGKLIMVLANQPQILMHSALPGLSELRGGGRHEHLSSVCASLTQAMLIASGAVVCVVLAVNKGFVSWWVGPEQYAGFLLTALVLLNMLLRHWSLTLGYVLFSFGRERRVAVTALFDGIVGVGGTLLLTYKFGLIGAPLGSLLGLCVVSLPCNVAAVSRINGASISSLLRPLRSWLWRFSVVALLCGAFAQFVVTNTFATLSATTIAVAAAYAAVMFQVWWRGPLGEYARPALAAIVARCGRALPGRRRSSPA
jgi:O-antigen/teichoic acid export membrane protein